MSPMHDLAYLDGTYLPRSEARVSVEDRGFLFADGVYEVTRYYGGRPFLLAEHVERFRKSLAAVRIELDWQRHDLERISHELVQRSGLADAQVYWQVTRGTAPRKHPFPSPPVPPTVLALVYPEPKLDARAAVRSLRAITRPDIRWKNCAIKSISLLPNILDTQAAVDAGVDAAILVRDGVVTECPSRSVFVVERGALLTYPLDGTVLESITRAVVLELARENGTPAREEGPRAERLAQADEVFVVGTTTEVTAVVEVDGQRIGTGRPGPLTERLQRLFVERVARTCGLREDASMAP